MLKVGITGGIGSGKTQVCQVFETLGIPVFNADTAAKKIMETDNEVVKQITKLLGAEAYINGKINRSWFSSILFQDEKKRTALNAIVHPAVIAFGQEWMNRQQAAYVLKEAALFFETGSNKEMDYMIGISAPVDLRLKRAMKRDHLDEITIRQKMAAQMDEKEKMMLCQFIILNDDETAIIPQVLSIHQQLLALAKN